MKCPYCGYENHDGVNFCVSCGARLRYADPPAPARQDSAVKKFAVACLKALCYFLVYFLIENAVVLVYELFIIGRMGIDAFMGGSSGVYGDFGALYDTLFDRISENMMLLLILATALSILTYCVIFLIRNKKPREEMYIRPVPLGEAGLAFLLGLSLNPFVSILLSLIPLPESLIESYNEQYALMLGGGSLVLEIIYVALLAPLMEEIVYRGLIFTRLRKGMSETVAFIITCIVFGAAHGTILGFVYAGLLCTVMLALFEKHESILLSLALHIGFNASSYLVELVPDDILLLLILLFVSVAASVALLYALFRPREAQEDEESTL